MLTVVCCGENRSSPFCPQYGRCLRRRDDLDGLLAHVEDKARSLRTAIANDTRRAERLEASGDVRNAKHRRSLVAGNARNLPRWESWARELRSLLERCGDQAADLQTSSNV
jgi:hypothetical protein